MSVADDSTRGSAPKVGVSLIWHFHQPDFRDPTGVGDMVLPWVRLHACRSYTDIAWLLERHPNVRAAICISPVLSDQLDDLAHGRCGDRFLDLSRRSASDLSTLDRMEILRGFFMADWERSVRPNPRYWHLLHKRGRDLKMVDLDRIAEKFSEDEMRDLQVLFNLVWMGSMARATHPAVQNLLRKGEGYTDIEKHVLLDVQETLVSQVLPRWRNLAARGQVELCTTPYYDPVLPLLLDTDSAREAKPDASLPPSCQRRADARLQIDRALEAHQRHFGMPASGILPSEGSVSHEVAMMVAETDLEWMVSDEAVLRRSIAEDGKSMGDLDHYRSWQVRGDDREITLLFRDSMISDLVGFSYSANPPAEAAADLIARLARIARDFHTRELSGGEPLVTLVIDGENPWELYLDSGRPFLEALFQGLASREHDGVTIHTTTPSRWLAESPDREALARLHAGSWVDGGFRVWIGHPETNLAWSMIGEAGGMLDTRGANLAPENREEALNHLLVAEGSDFTWWFGDDFVTETPEAFDALFRARLQKIYQLTGEATPPRLRRALSSAAARSQGIVLLREPWSLITPVIDGRAAPYVDWQGAGVYRPGQHLGKMYRATSRVDALHYGCDPTELYLRLDLSDEARAMDHLGDLEVQLVAGDREMELSMPLSRGSGRCMSSGELSEADLGKVCFHDIVEVAIPFAPLDLPGGETLWLVVRLLTDGVEIERLPRYGHLSIRIPRGDIPISGWQA